MGFRDLRPRYRYEKLTRGEDLDEERGIGSMRRNIASRRRCFWVKRMNGKLMRGLKISRSRKVSWKGFSWFVFPRKIARVYSEIVKRLIDLDGSNIIFATTWGFPVLSHNNSVKCRKSNVIPLDSHRSLGWI